MTNTNIIFCLPFALCLTIVGCHEGIFDSKTGPSNPPSLVTGVGGQAFKLSAPAPKSPQQIALFKSALYRHTIQAKAYPGHHVKQARHSFRSAVMTAIVDANGIPRTQLHPAMVHLLTDEKACGGVSCSRVFDVNPTEVTPFLDESAEIVNKDQNLATSDKAQTRDHLLVSFRRPEDFYKSEKSPLEPVFDTIEKARATISAVISEELPRIIRMIREQRYQINIDRTDDQLFMTKNCGPASIAVQKVLADRGLFTEARVKIGDRIDHEYLLYRTILQNGIKSDIIIDVTYRQFLFEYANRQLFKNFSGGTINDTTVFEKIDSYGLEPFLITEYSALDQTLARLKEKLPDFDERSEIRFAYEQGSLDPNRQKEHTEYLTQAQRERIRKGSN